MASALPSSSGGSRATTLAHADMRSGDVASEDATSTAVVTYSTAYQADVQSDVLTNTSDITDTDEGIQVVGFMVDIYAVSAPATDSDEARVVVTAKDQQLSEALPSNSKSRLPVGKKRLASRLPMKKREPANDQDSNGWRPPDNEEVTGGEPLDNEKATSGQLSNVEKMTSEQPSDAKETT
ncbi:hypothetical protein CYMTET_27322 [Cymbomonas tetramitiformis]|uniref:Uncharacterized protein n=1 Tax=Cymbomonas tetramitiformis TaxID=36881 RepID=A0AAE0FQG2_9CHLO|nr:hypothetical protein CYMTET_27322 [Cymbomonas tetramitiformis]